MPQIFPLRSRRRHLQTAIASRPLGWVRRTRLRLSPPIGRWLGARCPMAARRSEAAPEFCGPADTLGRSGRDGVELHARVGPLELARRRVQWYDGAIGRRVRRVKILDRLCIPSADTRGPWKTLAGELSEGRPAPSQSHQLPLRRWCWHFGVLWLRWLRMSLSTAEEDGVAAAQDSTDRPRLQVGLTPPQSLTLP